MRRSLKGSNVSHVPFDFFHLDKAPKKQPAVVQDKGKAPVPVKSPKPKHVLPPSPPIPKPLILRDSDPELMISNDVIQHEIDLLQGQKKASAITRRGILESRVVYLHNQVNKGLLSMMEYTELLEISIGHQKEFSQQYFKNNQREAATRCSMRVKIMEKEILQISKMLK